MPTVGTSLSGTAVTLNFRVPPPIVTPIPPLLSFTMPVRVTVVELQVLLGSEDFQAGLLTFDVDVRPSVGASVQVYVPTEVLPHVPVRGLVENTTFKPLGLK